MRIAQVAPLFISVPPKLSGGTERVVSYLTEELVAQGHEVTLFASGDSQTRAKLVSVCPQALWQVGNYVEPEQHYKRQMELVFDDVSRFDVIHFHTDSLHFPFLRTQPWPNVTTLHAQLAPWQKPFFDEHKSPLVSISDNQRLPVLEANWAATIYHGLPHDLYTFRKGPGDYLAFIGRASYEKRLDRAIRIACQAKMKLKVAAQINAGDQHYKHDIEPLLDEAQDWVEFIGEVGGREKDEFLGNAHALLFPIDWPEPFGLVMIESLACGTPVIAWRNGSVPEVIDDGRTGLIVESLDEAAQAVARVSGLNRETCHQVFEERFDAARMTHEYLEVYQRVASLSSK